MKIKQYKYEKIITESKDWEVPIEPKYYFETGVRRSISIVPRWTTWNVEQYQKPEEIYELEIVCVYQSFQAKIDAFSILLSQIEDLYSKKTDYDGPTSILQFLIDQCIPWEKVNIKTGEVESGIYNSRTKEQFDTDFKNCLESIRKHLK